MDEFTVSGVNEGASIPSSGESSTPMAADSGSAQEATPAQVPGESVEAPQSDAEQTVGSDAAAEESDPFDEQVAQVPEHQREQFSQLLQHKKNLDKDLRAMRSQVQPLIDRFGSLEAVQEQIARLEGLGSYAQDDIGQTVIDPNTGLPQLTTMPWLEQMASDSPGMLDQLVYDIWNLKDGDGQTQGAKLFWSAFQELGLDPQRVKEYAQMPASQVAVSQPVAAEELQYIREDLHDAYRHLKPGERKYVQELINSVQDEEANEYLEDANKRLQTEKRLEAFDAQIKQQEEQAKQQEQVEINNFWNDVNTSFTNAVREGNVQALATLNQQISSQVQFSSDPQANAIQSGMVSALVAAMCSPETRFAVQPILEQIGATIDPQLDQMLGNATQAERVYQAYAKLEQNDKFAQHRNSFQMKEARREADRLRQQAMAKVSPIAREASREDLNRINSRPSIGNGTVGGTGGTPAIPKGREFDASYRW